ncbi:hypothetical protein MKW92_014170 [Papaver armeniacum]|nr:hypothetical protein MKW92_014170 [Papaver armeniacum]
MSFEDLDIWDNLNFLEEAFRLEEELISKASKNPTQHFNQNHHPPPQPQPSLSSSYRNKSTTDYGFSPPREFSQRPFSIPTHQPSINPTHQPLANPTHQPLTNPTHQIPILVNDEEDKLEIDRLKKELGRVSEQLSNLEQECKEIKTDRDQKEEQLKNVMVQIAAKDDDDNHHLMNARAEYTSCNQDQSLITPWIGSKYLLPEAISKSVLDQRAYDPSPYQQPCENNGVTKKNNTLSGSSVPFNSRHPILIDSDPTTSNDCSIKTSFIPETTTLPKCTTSTGVQTDTIEYHSTINVASCSAQTLSNKMVEIWGSSRSHRSERDLVSRLLVTCAQDFHALFGCMSLSFLSKITPGSVGEESGDNMNSVQSVEASKVPRVYMMLTKMSNGMVKPATFFEALLELCSLQNVVVVHRSLCIVRVILQHMWSLGSRSDSRDNVMVEGICLKDKMVESMESGRMHTRTQFGLPGSASSNFSPDWGSVIQQMNQIASRNREEQIQVVAVSVMNLILMRSNPCLERERFGQKLLFEIVPKLLHKEVGMPVQKQALRLLFLLLNCPKLLMIFSAGIKDGMENECESYAGLSSILKGLADCVQCKDNGLEALRLRRHAIVVLAFIASSGNSGFEVLFNPEISKRINFLGMIVQALAAEVDAEATELAGAAEICKERTSLVRESLILLNRLASSTIYSATVLGILTSSRDMASLTTDVANRISKRGRMSSISAVMNTTKLDAEINDLARVFRSRVYSYLGNTVF